MLRRMERSTIQLLHKRGKSQREIAREFGRSRATVALALAEPVDRAPQRRRRAKVTDPYRERIAGWVNRQSVESTRRRESVPLPRRHKPSPQL